MTPSHWNQLKPGDIVRRTDPKDRSSYRIMTVVTKRKHIEFKIISLSNSASKEYTPTHSSWWGAREYCHLYELEHSLVCCI